MSNRTVPHRAVPPRAGAARRGYTLREALVVAALVVVIGGALVSWILSQRTQSRRELCMLRMAEGGKALEAYDQRQGHLPGYRVVQAVDAQGTPRAASWVFPLLPYLGEQTRFDTYGPAGPDATRGTRPDVLLPQVLCPDLPWDDRPGREARLSLVANCGLADSAMPEPGVPADWPANGALHDQFPGAHALAPANSLAYIEDRDGRRYTLLLSENVDAGRWTDGDEPRVGFVWAPHLVAGQPDARGALLAVNQRAGEGDGTHLFARPSSYHGGGVNAAFADLHGDFLSEGIDYAVYCQMMSVDRQEVKYAGRDEYLPPPFRGK